MQLRAVVRDMGQVPVILTLSMLCANVCQCCAQLYAKVYFNILKLNDFFIVIVNLSP